MHISVELCSALAGSTDPRAAVAIVSLGSAESEFRLLQFLQLKQKREWELPDLGLDKPL